MIVFYENNVGWNTYFLSLYHWIVGKGTPCTLHSKMISSLRVAATSLTGSEPTIIGGTGTQEYNKEELQELKS